MMKLPWWLLTGTAVAASATRTAASTESQGVQDPTWAFRELGSAHLALGSCVHAHGIVAVDQAECLELAGHVWHQAYTDAAAFHADAELAAAEGPLRLAAMRSGVRLADLRAQLAESQVEVVDVLTGPSSTWLVINSTWDGPELAFQTGLPHALKMSPLLAHPATRETRSHCRRVILAPQHLGRERVVAEAWRERHSARRRVLEQSDRAEAPIVDVSHGDGALILVAKVDPEADPAADQAALADLDWFAHMSEALWVEDAPKAHLADEDANVFLQSGYHVMEGYWSFNRQFWSSIDQNLDMSWPNSNERFSPGVASLPFKPDLRPFWSAGVRGDGEIVTVVDSGVQVEHCMFSDPAVDDLANTDARRTGNAGVFNYPNHRKVVQYARLAGSGDLEEGTTSGHGTHVASILAGSPEDPTTWSPHYHSFVFVSTDENYTAPTILSQGIAPGARIAVMDVVPRTVEGDVSGTFTPPDDAAKLFNPGYEIGSRIFSNSWGIRQNLYTSLTRSVDQFLFEHQDAVAVFAAGNRDMSDDFRDPYPFKALGNAPLNSPAGSKNAIAVGALRNTPRAWTRTSGGRGLCGSAILEEGGTRRREPCNLDMSPFSVTGPGPGGRSKPDLVAPGEMVTGARSSDTDKCGVTDKLGTSMSTPLVAGQAAMVRQWFRQGFHPSGQADPARAFEPLGSLVKATLVHIARLVYDRSVPNPHFGWGVPVLDQLQESPEREVLVFGRFSSSEPRLESRDDEWRLEFDVPASAELPLRVTLAFYDPGASPGQAGFGVLNKLFLAVETPSGQLIGPTRSDRLDTVQQIDISPSNLEAGVHTIRVGLWPATELTVLRLPFSVVVSGPRRTVAPTASPFVRPSSSPTRAPTATPSSSPTSAPTQSPESRTPTASPTQAPTQAPVRTTVQDTSTDAPATAPPVRADDSEGVSAGIAAASAAMGTLAVVGLAGGTFWWVQRRRRNRVQGDNLRPATHSI